MAVWERLKAADPRPYLADLHDKFKGHRSRRLRSAHELHPLRHTDIHPSARIPFELCVGLVAAIFILNLVVAIWAASTHPSGDGLTVTLFQGNCNTASRANFWVHLLINILATSLFAASTYVMQRLAAPSRQDIDRAHQAGSSLTIGCLAVTNFALMSSKRLWAFLLLWLSSFPIHLMYNCLIVYTTTNAQWSSYGMVVREDFLPRPAVNTSMLSVPDRTQLHIYNDTESNEYLLDWIVSQQPPLQRLAISDCIEAYSTGSSLDMGDVLLVAKPEVDQSLFEGIGGFPATVANWPIDVKTLNTRATYKAPWAWLCGVYSSNACIPGSIVDSGAWAYNVGTGNFPIDYCLARRMPPLCQLNMSLGIMIAVLVCNLGKLCAMVFALFLCGRQPLVTVGDALSSFLETNDDTTKGLCVAEKQYFPGYFDDSRTNPALVSTTGYQKINGTIELRKFSASDADRSVKDPDPDFQLMSDATLRKTQGRVLMVRQELSHPYYWSNLLGLTSLGLAFYFFGSFFRQSRSTYANAGYEFDIAAMWRIGLGVQPPLHSESQGGFMSYSGDTSPSQSYVAGAVIANLPQLGLSLLYLLYNNFFTRFFMALEHRSYATRRQGLRVSQPQPGSQQRATYFLQFPLRWSLITIAYFAVAHTFLSESIFLRRTNAIWPQGFTDATSVGTYLVSNIGFSLLGAFLFAMLLFALVAFSIGIGFWKTDWVLPCTNGNSRALSAACHPPKECEDVHLAAVRWGVTAMGLNGIGHCSFSSRPVRMPEQGERYI